MNFELGKEYIVRVTEKGIIPIDEFDRARFFDKDCDELDFLTDEEKKVVILSTLQDLKDEMRGIKDYLRATMDWQKIFDIDAAIEVLNKKIEEITNEKL